MFGQLKVLVGCFAVLMLAACAQPARVSQMAVQNVSGSQLASHPGLIGTLAIDKVEGGEKTSPLWTSEVGNPEFTSALRQSLLANGLLAAEPDSALYNVTATLIEVDQPFGGFDLEVKSTVAYKVVRKRDDILIFDTEVAAAYTAKFGDSFYAVERLRLANEGSIRSNITQFMSQFVQAWAKLPEARELDAVALAAEPTQSAAAAPQAAVAAAAPMPAAAPSTSAPEPPKVSIDQQAFEAWLATNRGELTQEFTRYFKYGDGKGYHASWQELQDISEVRFIERRPEGYVAAITYKLGGISNVEEYTDIVLIKISNDRIMGMTPV